jgi:hypothetical protein
VVALPSDETGRPHPKVGPKHPEGDQTTNAELSLAFERRADLEMRLAWLRVTGHEMFAIDDSGQLSAHLWDFADLLKVADHEGWFDR